MDQDSLERCQRTIGYTFSDPSLLRLCLTHASLAPSRVESNERLEFLGDAVLGLTVCQELYEQFDSLLEGQMTKIKSSVVSRKTCAIVAEETGIAGLLLLGKGMPSPDGLPTSVAAAVFESIIGAIYVDGGLEPARQFVLKHIRPYIDEACETEHQRNYKSTLQQHLQHKFGQTPEYHLLDEKGPDHSKCFEVAVSTNGRNFPSAWGMTKKEAEQRAAQEALLALGLLDEEPPEPEPLADA